MLWQGFSRNGVAAGWSLPWIVVTAGWSHYCPAKPCLAACWFLLILDGIFHRAELTSVGRQEHLLSCPGWLQLSPAQQHLRKSEEPHGNNYHSVLVGQLLSVQCLWFGFGPRWLRDGSAGPIPSSGQPHVPCCTQASFGKTNCLSFSLTFQVGRLYFLRKKQHEKKQWEKEIQLFVWKGGGNCRNGINTWKDLMWWEGTRCSIVK